jgi:hypothetical protein
MLKWDDTVTFGRGNLQAHGVSWVNDGGHD